MRSALVRAALRGATYGPTGRSALALEPAYAKKARSVSERNTNLTMALERVWLRFEKKKKDGTTWRLRIQDVPPARLDEVIDLQATYFPRDAVINKAIGVSKNPEAVKEYKEDVSRIMRDPTCSTVICCEDNGDEVGDILGISCATNGKEIKMSKENLTVERKKLFEVTSEMHNASKAFKSSLRLHDVSIVVMPNYRGYGIAQQFLKTRRIMCKEFKIPITGAWMSGYGTQVAAAKEGWTTVCEIKYEDLAKTHDLVFEDAPPMLKYMVAEPLEEE